MSIKFKATCDRILCLVPLAPETEEIVGTIIVPANARKAMADKNPLRELTVESVGPDVKIVRAGDRIIYNMHQCGPVPFEDTQLVVISENQVFCVVERTADAPAADPKTEGKPVPEPEGDLTVDQIRAKLKEQGTQPEEPPAANAPVA